MQCAVKTLRPKSTAEDQDQFVDECLLQCPLKHESIVEIMGVCMAGQNQFVVFTENLFENTDGVLL